mmetsp:Transcript_150833/g.262755  ORF Transcript_150833/g.262755 Transcript_150833/m.262755 type:complete len:131 (-) Transcript_150833:1571-1963(-)
MMHKEEGQKNGLRAMLPAAPAPRALWALWAAVAAGPHAAEEEALPLMPGTVLTALMVQAASAAPGWVQTSCHFLQAYIPTERASMLTTMQEQRTAQSNWNCVLEDRKTHPELPPSLSRRTLTQYQLLQGT